jgi:hypothetical protein
MIYFVQENNGPIKIGYSRSPHTRICSIKTNSSSAISLLGVIKGTKEEEKQLHSRFSHLRVRGEWFSPSEELLGFIKGAQKIDVPFSVNSKALLPRLDKIIKDLGENIRLARLRRRITSVLLAERAGISRPILRKIEQGWAGCSMASYACVLLALGLEKDLERVAKDDELGRKLQDIKLGKRVRRSVYK